MTRRRLGVPAALLLGTAVALTACTDGAYSSSTVEQQLPALLADHGYAGMTVTCPQLVDRPGAAATCTATDGANTYPVLVTRDQDQTGWAWKIK